MLSLYQHKAEWPALIGAFRGRAAGKRVNIRLFLAASAFFGVLVEQTVAFI